MGSSDPSGELAREQRTEGALERELREITSLSTTEEEEEGEGEGGTAVRRSASPAGGEVRLQLGGSRLDDLSRIEPLPGEAPRGHPANSWGRHALCQEPREGAGLVARH